MDVDDVRAQQRRPRQVLGPQRAGEADPGVGALSGLAQEATELRRCRRSPGRSRRRASSTNARVSTVPDGCGQAHVAVLAAQHRRDARRRAGASSRSRARASRRRSGTSRGRRSRSASRRCATRRGEQRVEVRPVLAAADVVAVRGVRGAGRRAASRARCARRPARVAPPCGSSSGPRRVTAQAVELEREQRRARRRHGRARR